MTHKTLLNAGIALALACLMLPAYAQTQDVADAEPTVQAASNRAPSWTLKPVNVTAKRGLYSTADTTAATRTETPLI
ncbi:putative membrane protein [Xanthomonas bromi]|uniref:Putative membrane protein n=1 Tax=Xanthomonas bromi TaxID=56449 RepID=A0A1C3NS38_9XANT|nr:hypothetical protein [Xanthomonas bromi]SBV53176.1 putative membrane protein [Xanthomonas bromi]